VQPLGHGDSLGVANELTAVTTEHDVISFECFECRFEIVGEREREVLLCEAVAGGVAGVVFGAVTNRRLLGSSGGSSCGCKKARSPCAWRSGGCALAKLAERCGVASGLLAHCTVAMSPNATSRATARTNRRLGTAAQFNVASVALAANEVDLSGI
jgi:hypothetical protein